MIETLAIIGAGNGGKGAAADLTLQGKKVRLFDFPEFVGNLAGLKESRTITATGAVAGTAVLEAVTTDLGEAMRGADAVMVCTQALAHEGVAREVAPFLRPGQVIIINPGSTGGALQFAQVFRAIGVKKQPVMVETSTLTYGVRAKGASVHFSVKANRVLYGVFPGRAAASLAPELEALYPGFVRGRSVLEAGLNNGNPVIHPPITILNAGRIEKQGPAMKYYADGVSPAVARMIRKLDEERMAILRALGYPAQAEPVTCIQQGYAESEDYFKCYGQGSGFVEFTSPDTLDHRYFHEDIGMGLVMLCSLGEFLQVPTPACRAFVQMGELISGVPYYAEGKRTLSALGLAGLDLPGLHKYLDTGELP